MDNSVKHIRNINDLREELAQVITDIRNKTLMPNEASVIVRSATVILSTARLEIENCKATGEVPNIPFIPKREAKKELPPVEEKESEAQKTSP